MKKYILSFCLMLIGFTWANAQSNNEVNPSAQWKFVRTNDVKLVTGQLQTFEFPAYRTHDYILNLEAKTDSLNIEMYIYDMQSQLLYTHKEKGVTGSQFEFNVKHNATYQIALRVIAQDGTLQEVETLMSLLKRPKM